MVIIVLVLLLLIIGVGMTTQQGVRNRAFNLATIRRLYFYLVALVSFIAALVGLDNLLRNLSDAWLGSTGISQVNSNEYLRNNIASSASVLLVATPIFLLHWGFVQRRQNESGEPQSALRKFFLYAASGVALGYAVANTYTLLNGIARLALGEPLADSNIWPSDWLHLVVMTLAATLLQFYFHHVLVHDGDYGTEEGLPGTWRRIYQALVGLAGLAMLIYGASQLIDTGWRALIGLFYASIGAGWWQAPLADGITFVLIGSVLVRINWLRWLRITNASQDEGKAALRRFYLYAAVVISALAALVPTAELLRQLLLLILGSGNSSMAELLDNLATPIAYIPIGIIAWVWHWRIVRDEAAAYGESHEGATVRRLYYYSVAAAGLVLLWLGAIDLLQALLDRLLVVNQASDSAPIWVDPLAEGLSLLVVGAPIWSLHWRAMQRVARQTDSAGNQERASGPRKVYLYGVALVGALLILFYLAQVVYRLLLLALGDPNANLFSAETVDNIARSAIAAILWGVHVLAIRGDSQLGTEAPEPAPAAVGEDREVLLKRIEQLENELAAARAALAKLES